MIISFCTSKGGASKSMLTMLTANILSCDPFNKKVCVVDCDKQLSIFNTRQDDKKKAELLGIELLPPYEIFAYNAAELKANIDRLNGNYDYVFLDVAGKHDVKEYLQYADILFLIFISGNFAFSSSLSFLEVLEEIEDHRLKFDLSTKILGIKNRLQPKHIETQRLLNRIKKLQTLKVLSNGLNEYTSFNRLNTIESPYNENPTTPQDINIKDFFTGIYNEIIKQEAIINKNQ